MSVFDEFARLDRLPPLVRRRLGPRYCRWCGKVIEEGARYILATNKWDCAECKRRPIEEQVELELEFEEAGE